jgi:AcrR family transcriptional regulator
VRRTAQETRAHVLGVARDLFYWNGIRATGIDTVARRAGVAPTTLYRLFPSKDDLVGAYVEADAEGYRAWFTGAVAAAGDDPREQVLAVFDALAVQVRPENCRGCPFVMALTEFPEPDLPAHVAAVALKSWVRERFAELAADLGRPELGDHLALIMEGVYASVQALGDDGPARAARDLVGAVLGAG